MTAPEQRLQPPSVLSAGGRMAEPDERRAEIRRLVDAGGPRMVFQPLVDLRDMRVLAIEALARLPDRTTPIRWFADAHRVGEALDLELAAISAALHEVRKARQMLPDGIDLCVKASPTLICAPQLGEILAGSPLPVTVEVGRRAVLENHPSFLSAVSDLRTAGIGLAVDDVIADYASFGRSCNYSRT